MANEESLVNKHLGGNFRGHDSILCGRTLGTMSFITKDGTRRNSYLENEVKVFVKL